MVYQRYLHLSPSKISNENSNIRYNLELAQQQYFKSEEFMNYLKYLQYWKEPQYAKFIV
jgi:hypothetical protein